MNGAGGTLYLLNSKVLYIKHTTRCRSLLRTIVDPQEIFDQGVTHIYVQDRGVMAFTTKAIDFKDKRISATINNLSLVNGNLTDPVPVEGKLKHLELEIKGSLILEEATILNPALVCKITSSNLKIGQFSSIMYGDKSLWLNVTGSFSILGNIYPFNLNYGEAGTTPTVYIIAGVQPDGSDPPQGAHSFIIHNTSSVIGNYIQIFTDEDMIIKGNLNNYYRDRDNEWRIVQSCRLVDSDLYIQKDVFRCVRQYHTTKVLNHDFIIERFNKQFNETSPAKKFSDLFEKMTRDFSIYIQSLKNIQIEGNITGNRLGF